MALEWRPAGQWGDIRTSVGSQNYWANKRTKTHVLFVGNYMNRSTRLGEFAIKDGDLAEMDKAVRKHAEPIFIEQMRELEDILEKLKEMVPD